MTAGIYQDVQDSVITEAQQNQLIQRKAQEGLLMWNLIRRDNAVTPRHVEQGINQDWADEYREVHSELY